MPGFDSDGVNINYVDEGQGPPIVLVHGFAGSIESNWRAPGIIGALVRSGRRVVALDCRGHGQSGKPHDPDAYSGTKMPDDVVALMDHLGIAKADLMGYSMGGGIATSLMLSHPSRFGAVVIGGAGYFSGGGGERPGRFNPIAEALEAPDASTLTDPMARGLRAFAERGGNDLLALAAIQRSSRAGAGSAGLGTVSNPVLVLVGSGDPVLPSAQQLAGVIPGAKLMVIPGDHLAAVRGPAYAASVVEFLASASPI
ncbi:MAG: alpha/beta fold hydrolase [Dehalococcoidia bacterium]|nr:alpha/beta fold hydrolase [Dehalococcoidia bacterium]